MQIFWISLPFLLTIVVVAAIFLELYFILLNTALVAVVGVVVFFYARSLAQANQEIRRERSELHHIVMNLEDPLVVFTQGFTITLFNPAAERLFRLRAAEVLGKDIAAQDVHSPEKKFLAQALFPSLSPLMISRSEAGVYPQVVDVSLSDPQSELRLITHPIYAEDGSVLGFMRLIRDRTRDVALLKSKSEFITVASHQLRTPLTGINWALHSLEEDASLSSAAKELVGRTLQATRQVLDIVEDLLHVAKIEEGRFGYAFEALDLVEFINQILAALIPQAKEVDVAVYFDHPPTVPPVVADRQKLAMVLQNLLDNALRYNVKNGEIRVRAEPLPQEPAVQVTVRDTGIGIPREDYEKVFVKFFRSKNALKYETEGSGLGLYIAQNIVRAHGGRMWFESEVNRGSVFYFTVLTDASAVPQREVPLEY